MIQRKRDGFVMVNGGGAHLRFHRAQIGLHGR